jgi:hypothetical protein
LTITTQETWNSKIQYVGDGTIKGDGAGDEFAVPFPYLNRSHLYVTIDDVKKVLNTDWFLSEEDPGGGSGKYAKVYFAAAPGNGAIVEISRVTPDALYEPNPTFGHIAALQAFYRMQELADVPVILPWFANQTDVLAPTDQELIAPCDGTIVRSRMTVQAAVTTGGAVTFKKNTTAIDGLTHTVADGATAGTRYSDKPTAGHATTFVRKGDRISVAFAAGFATAGALNGFLEIKPASGVAAN